MAEMLIGPHAATVNRPDAPYTLTDLESDQWRAIVASMEPDYFQPSHYAMLSQLCRHIVAANRVAQLIESVAKQEKFDRSQFTALLSSQAAESNIIIRLCRQLRLSHQAIYRADCTKQRPVMALDPPWGRNKTKTPWDDDDNDDEDDKTQPRTPKKST